LDFLSSGTGAASVGVSVTPSALGTPALATISATTGTLMMTIKTSAPAPVSASASAPGSTSGSAPGSGPVSEASSVTGVAVGIGSGVGVVEASLSFLLLFLFLRTLSQHEVPIANRSSRRFRDLRSLFVL